MGDHPFVHTGVRPVVSYVHLRAVATGGRTATRVWRGPMPGVPFGGQDLCQLVAQPGLRGLHRRITKALPLRLQRIQGLFQLLSCRHESYDGRSVHEMQGATQKPAPSPTTRGCRRFCLREPAPTQQLSSP
jgi:hypothetical protein